MRPILFYWLSLLVAGLSACRPDPTTGTTSVSGQVVEYQTKKPVANASVQLYRASSGGGYVAVGSPHASDGQGRFGFSFEAERQGDYLLRASAAPGYTTDWALAPSLKAGGMNADVVIPVYAPAWVRLQLVDEPPKSRVVVHTQGYEGPGDTFYYPRDTTVIRPTLAGFKPAIAWWIDELGQTKTSSVYIQPGALDTVTVHIRF